VQEDFVTSEKGKTKAELIHDNEKLRKKLAKLETKLARAKEALKQAEWKVQVSEHSPAVLYTSKPDGDYGATYISENIREQLGYVPEDFTGDSGFWVSHIHPDDRPQVIQNVLKVFDSGHHIHEYRFLRRDGTYLWMRDEFKLVKDKRGKPRHLTGYWIDITSRKQIEQQLRERTAELEAVNQELESFAYTTSHDLQAPLLSIRGFSQLLLDDHAGNLDPVAIDNLQRIVTAADRMSVLIFDLLELSKTTRAELTRRRTDLSTVAREILSGLQRVDPGRKVDMVIMDGVEAVGDPALLRQVLENLIGNSWKFTSAMDQAWIEFGRSKQDGETTYYVRDNGPGFPAESAEQLFLPFQRLYPDSEFPGSGIGLATVRRIIHRHGGRVWATGQPGRGATFNFTLAQDKI
jgi:PAS domain S-box-containing protein